MPTELTTVTQGFVSQELLDVSEQDEGLGVSFKPEDQLLPLIYVLQTNSPSVNKRGDAYIQGAEPGHFWLRNSLNPIRDGAEGIAVIPCEMVRTWIEWLPNRGGFVARHDIPPQDMVTKLVRGDDGRERSVLQRESGNILQDTREFYVIEHGFPYVLPCTGTKHTFARSWQSMFHQFRHPKTGKIMSAFTRKYRLTTVPMSNAVGEWFGLKFQDMGEVTISEYNEAKAFYYAVKKGEKKAEAPVEGAEHTEGGEIPF
jgi:hypothetical protein